MRRIVSIIFINLLIASKLYCQRSSLGIFIAPTIKNFELTKIDSILYNPIKLSRNYVRFGGNWNVTIFENLQLLIEPQIEYNISNNILIALDFPIVARLRFGKDIKFITDFGITNTLLGNPLDYYKNYSKTGYLYGGGIEYKLGKKVNAVWILRHSVYTFDKIMIDNSNYSMELNQFTFNFCLQLKP
jgi:hypothetical protein